jgi:hypothetical protein
MLFFEPPPPGIQSPDPVGLFFLCCGGLVALILYFLPSMIAFARHHRNAVAILVLNLFLGWTFLGWIISLVWSFTSDK